MSETPRPTESPAAGAGAAEAWDVDQEWLEEWSHLRADEGGPQCVDDAGVSDEELLATRGPASVWDLPLLDSMVLLDLDRDGQLDYLRRIEGIEALLAAQKARGLVALAGTDSSDSMRDRHVAMEVAQVRRVGEGAAFSAIATARALHGEFPQFLAALSAGEVSEWHCRVLVTETAHGTDPQTLAALQDRLLPKARRLPAPESA